MASPWAEGTSVSYPTYRPGMTHYAPAVALLGCFSFAACSVSVDHDEHHSRADVQIRTPMGHVFVKTGEQLPDTGLAIYPGSVPVRQHREAESADVSVGNSLFGVKVAAANFSSAASPHAIVEYYRQAMRRTARSPSARATSTSVAAVLCVTASSSRAPGPLSWPLALNSGIGSCR